MTEGPQTVDPADVVAVELFSIHTAAGSCAEIHREFLSYVGVELSRGCRRCRCGGLGRGRRLTCRPGCAISSPLGRDRPR